MKHFNWESSHPERKQGKSQKNILVVAVVIIASLIIGGIYIHYSWDRYQKMSEIEAIRLAESIGAVLPAGHIFKLSIQGKTPELSNYDLVKEKLMGLVESTSRIHYAFILAEHNQEVFILVDSNKAATFDYLPLVDLGAEISDSAWVPFQTDSSIITKPMDSQWGAWIRALVPIKEPGSGKIIAILGLSYSASEWNKNVWDQMTADISITISSLLLLYALLFIWTKHKTFRMKRKDLAFNEELYRNLFYNAPRCQDTN
jgi:hypothetical protein